MAFFDEPRPRQVFGAATVRGTAAVLRAAPATFVVSVVLMAIFLAVALAVTVVTNEAVHRLHGAVESAEVTAYLRSGVSRDDAVAAAAGIGTMPSVRAARLRTREEALAALSGAALPTLGPGTNPLPDAVVAELRIPVDDGAPLADRFETARETLVTVPSVESAVFDRPWVERLAGWRSESRVHAGRIIAGTAAFLAVVMFGVGFLAGRAYGAAAPAADEVPGANAMSLLLTGLLATFVAVAATLAFAAFAVDALGAALSTMQPLHLATGLMVTPWAWQLVAGTAFATVVGHAISATHR